MAKIAIIKTGATGDVVRTSVLLRLFENDEITWVTAPHNKEVLPAKRAGLQVTAVGEDLQLAMLREHYDLVISLDDDPYCASLATALKTDQLIGAYLKDRAVVYSDDSREWFDMGLSSRFPKEQADAIKRENRSSYQAILFRMLGQVFDGEEYLIREDVQSEANSPVIGIEARAGARWPTKVWNRYDELAAALRQDGHPVVFFREREHVRDYMQDIGRAGLIIGGDTLGMHIALALKIPSVILFTCTSHTEIYGYGRIRKIVSPYLNDAFYKTTYVPEAVNAISLETVQGAVLRMVGAVG